MIEMVHLYPCTFIFQVKCGMKKQQTYCICDIKQVCDNFYAINDLFIAYFIAINSEKKIENI
eukprot:UN02171